MAKNNQDKILPQSEQAEKSVLGGLLLDEDAIVKVVDILSSNDFYKPKHKKIYQACLKLFENDSPIDTITLTDKLKDLKNLEDVGGASYIAELANFVGSSAHIRRHAKIVADKATLRRLISASSTISELAFDSSMEAEEIIDKAEGEIFNLSKQSMDNKFTPIEDILEESFERIDSLHKDKESLRGIPTHFKDLDSMISGLQPSDLIILAGRPSMGKSTLALNIAVRAAIQDKVPVGVFSLEMSKEQLVDRLICEEAQVDSWKLRTGNLSDDDFVKIGQAMGTLSEAPIFLEDTPALSAMEIRAKARRLQAEHEIKMVIVDYLQLIEGQGNSDNRVQQMSQISRSLKALARELDVPVIALSQLSRAVESRDPQIPRLSDLRESGSIEQDADLVIMLYREDYYDPETENKNITDIIIGKHRNGPTGQVQLYFSKEQLAFKDLDKNQVPDSVPQEEDIGF
jgi:replicative DNA helicase